MYAEQSNAPIISAHGSRNEIIADLWYLLDPICFDIKSMCILHETGMTIYSFMEDLVSTEFQECTNTAFYCSSDL